MIPIVLFISLLLQTMPVTSALLSNLSGIQ